MTMPINRVTDTTISVNIDRQLAEKFKKWAKIENRTASGQARELIIRYVNEMESKTEPKKLAQYP